MEQETVTHTAALWRWTANNGVSWFFLTIDGEAGEALSGTALMRKLENPGKRGWGGVKVTATIGDSEWQTSVFPKRKQTVGCCQSKRPSAKQSGSKKAEKQPLRYAFKSVPPEQLHRWRATR